tara:strand:- start:334 stop:1041 length:708 start_codon:yes stop_codon:yes gene_type:complete
MTVPLEIIAHRGLLKGPSKVLENRKESLLKSLKLGFKLELDTRSCLSGESVIHHDERILGVEIAKTTLSDLQSLDPGLLSLEAFLSQCSTMSDTQVKINIDVKTCVFPAAFISLLEAYPKISFELSSFDWTLLRQLHAVSTKRFVFSVLLADSDTDPIAALKSAVSVAKEIQAKRVTLQLPLLDKLSKAALKELGDCRLGVYTVNEVAKLSELTDKGISYLFTDYPELFLDTVSA